MKAPAEQTLQGSAARTRADGRRRFRFRRDRAQPALHPVRHHRKSAGVCHCRFSRPASFWLAIMRMLFGFSLLPSFVVFLARGVCSCRFLCLRRARKKRITEIRGAASGRARHDRALASRRPSRRPSRSALVAREMPDPLGTEFGIVSDEITFGLSLEQAVRKLSERVGFEGLHLLSVSLSIQAKTGGNLTEILVQSLEGSARTAEAANEDPGAFGGRPTCRRSSFRCFPLVMFGILALIAPSYYGDVWDSPLITPVFMIFGAVGAAWRLHHVPHGQFRFLREAAIDILENLLGLPAISFRRRFSLAAAFLFLFAVFLLSPVLQTRRRVAEQLDCRRDNQPAFAGGADRTDANCRSPPGRGLFQGNGKGEQASPTRSKPSFFARDSIRPQRPLAYTMLRIGFRGGWLSGRLSRAVQVCCRRNFRHSSASADRFFSGLACIVIPSIALDRFENAQKQKYRRGFPDFMDMMITCADAGMSLEAAVERVSSELAGTHKALGHPARHHDSADARRKAVARSPARPFRPHRHRGGAVAGGAVPPVGGTRHQPDRSAARLLATKCARNASCGRRKKPTLCRSKWCCRWDFVCFRWC